MRFDAVPEEAEGAVNHQHNIRRNTFETSATFTPLHNAASTTLRNSSLKLGYIVDDVKRTGRAFGDMTDYTFRLSLDTYGNQYVMLRGIFENTRRVGSGLSIEAIEEGGAQPGLRFFDEAPYDRNNGTLILQLTPSEKFELGFSLSAAKDEYHGDGQEFGLLDNSNSSYNVTFTAYPAERITLGGNFGYEKFSALQKSRNANPATTSGYNSWIDVGRDWNLDNGETVKNLGLSLDLIKALPKTDVRLSYDRSSSDNAFTFSGPRIQALTTNVAPTAGDALP